MQIQVSYLWQELDRDTVMMKALGMYLSEALTQCGEDGRSMVAIDKIAAISLDAQRPRGYETLKQTLSKRQPVTESPLAEAFIPVAEEIVMLQSNPCSVMRRFWPDSGAPPEIHLQYYSGGPGNSGYPEVASVTLTLAKLVIYLSIFLFFYFLTPYYCT